MEKDFEYAGDIANQQFPLECVDVLVRLKRLSIELLNRVLV